MIQLVQTLTFPVIGDGSSTVFSYDLEQPPFNSSEFTGSGTQPFILGSPVSVTVSIEPQQVSGDPLTWQPNTTYPTGRVVEWNDQNGISYVFQCTVPGVSGASNPNFPFVNGQTVLDGLLLLWTCLGANNVVPQYLSPTATASLTGSVATVTFNTPLQSQSITDTYGNVFNFPFWVISLNLFYNSYS